LTMILATSCPHLYRSKRQVEKTVSIVNMGN